MIRLFHKDLEAYLVAEGLYEETLTEDGMCYIRTNWFLSVRCLHTKQS